MKQRRMILWGMLTLALLAIIFPSSLAFSKQPVIRAVLFFSPTCPHCHIVIDQVLPPLVDQYPGQLDIVGIDVTHPVGGNLYQAAIAKFNIPSDRLGVPTLIVGQDILVGSNEIPDKFPAIIQAGLAAGGIDWPAIPDLDLVLAAQGNEQPVTTISTSGQEQTSNGRPAFVNTLSEGSAGEFYRRGGAGWHAGELPDRTDQLFAGFGA